MTCLKYTVIVVWKIGESCFPVLVIHKLASVMGCIFLNVSLLRLLVGEGIRCIMCVGVCIMYVCFHSGYSEDGGVMKGEVIPEHEFAAGPVRLDDETEFPPVSIQNP